jgi:hypothetical protein
MTSAIVTGHASTSALREDALMSVVGIMPRVIS